MERRFIPKRNSAALQMKNGFPARSCLIQPLNAPDRGCAENSEAFSSPQGSLTTRPFQLRGMKANPRATLLRCGLSHAKREFDAKCVKKTHRNVSDCFHLASRGPFVAGKFL